MAGKYPSRLVRIGNGTKRHFGLYRCSCGVEKQCNDYSVKYGRVSSCGCLRTEVKFKHGRIKTRTYGIWAQMIQRTTNPNKDDYEYYGGRGIQVCDRWRDSFADFLADMGEAPDGMTLERKDNSGHYEPGNVVWATRKAQARNTRRTVNLTHNGETMCVEDWAERLGVKANTLIVRLRRGWSTADTLGTGVRPDGPRVGT